VATTILVDVEERAGDLHLRACDGQSHCELVLPRQLIESRTELLTRLHNSEDESVVGTLLTQDWQENENRLGRRRLARELALWDYEEIVLGLDLPGRSSARILYPAGVLDGFSVRSAIRSAIAHGLVAGARLRDLVSIPIWTSAGLAARLEHGLGRAPVAARTAVLLAAPARSPEAWRGSMARGEQDDFIKHRVDHALYLEAASQAIELDLLRAAKTAGAVVFPACSVAQAASSLRCHEFENYLVAAHQSEDGVQFVDGALSPLELHVLLDERTTSGNPVNAIDWGVCSAEEAGNLAAHCESAGVTQILTHGRYSYYVEMISHFVDLLEALPSGAPTLYQLADIAWLSRWEGASSADLLRG
jgi:hypothetical protein